MKIKIKKLHPDAVIPQYSKNGDACFDLTAIEINTTSTYVEYVIGLAIEIPEGYFGLLRPRSSISTTDLIFNTSGIIDSGYRGDLKTRFKMSPHILSSSGKAYKVGDRVAQLMILPYPKIELEEVEELSETERGTGGYGSTGK